MAVSEIRLEVTQISFRSRVLSSSEDVEEGPFHTLKRTAGCDRKPFIV